MNRKMEREIQIDRKTGRKEEKYDEMDKTEKEIK